MSPGLSWEASQCQAATSRLARACVRFQESPPKVTSDRMTDKISSLFAQAFIFLLNHLSSFLLGLGSLSLGTATWSVAFSASSALVPPSLGANPLVRRAHVCQGPGLPRQMEAQVLLVSLLTDVGGAARILFLSPEEPSLIHALEHPQKPEGRMHPFFFLISTFKTRTMNLSFNGSPLSGKVGLPKLLHSVPIQYPRP